MGRHRVGGGDRRQLATALVKDEIEPEEGLQPATEPGSRPPRSLGDRSDPPPRRAVEVKHAIRLSVTDAPQDDRLGLVAPRHGQGNMTSDSDAWTRDEVPEQVCGPAAPPAR